MSAQLQLWPLHHLIEVVASAGNIQELNASKLTGYLGDATVTLRDAPMIKQGDHLSQMPDGCDD